MPDAVSAPVLGGGSDKLDLDPEVFGAPFNGPLVHEVVIAELAARRQGTHATRTRGMVAGGGAKPWRQKGTGRARAGTSRSPLWTGGGTVFGPSPRHYTVKVNRKARKAALRSALSIHAERGSIHGLDAATFDAPSTKTAAGLLSDRQGSVLVVVGPEQDVAFKSFRNLERVTVLPAEAAGVADIVGAAQLVVTQDALDALTARAKGTAAKRSAAGGERSETDGEAKS
jgi:large subunit ribosomal protein L4